MLEGKVAIVTGGTRGIGLEIVRTFLEQGASVCLLGSRKETVDKALETLKQENDIYKDKLITFKLCDNTVERQYSG